jgi:hypothetical protein
MRIVTLLPATTENIHLRFAGARRIRAALQGRAMAGLVRWRA